MSTTLFETRPEDHLTKEPKQEALLNTYLGMAHIAGTGPKGATRRECIFYGEIAGRNKDTGQPEMTHIYYSAKRKDAKAGLLRNHRCHRPITSKATNQFPHKAAACRLFERNENPPVKRIPVKKKGADQ